LNDSGRVRQGQRSAARHTLPWDLNYHKLDVQDTKSEDFTMKSSL
jgi:hypothetical protein